MAEEVVKDVTIRNPTTTASAAHFNRTPPLLADRLSRSVTIGTPTARTPDKYQEKRLSYITMPKGGPAVAGGDKRPARDANRRRSLVTPNGNNLMYLTEGERVVRAQCLWSDALLLLCMLCPLMPFKSAAFPSCLRVVFLLRTIHVHAESVRECLKLLANR